MILLTFVSFISNLQGFARYLQASEDAGAQEKGSKEARKSLRKQ